MADGLELNAASGGSTLATAEVTFSGETMECEIVGVGLISGTAESYSVNLASAGAGAVGVGVQRMTLASDDPGVVSLAIIDDWDESDRAKVNLIVGQAGITAGAGAVGASTPRITLASDDPAVALLATIDADTSTLAGAVSGSEMQVDIVAMLSVVDANNSSTATLLSGATFTGTATDTLNYSHVTIAVFADQVSGTDGLSVEWSEDATNWDNCDVFTIAASTGKVFSFGPPARYVRVLYTNGGTGQGAFRLQTILRVGQQSASSHRIADAISGQDDAELVKTVVTGLAPDTTFKNVLVTNNGEMKISLESINGVEVPIKGTVAHDAPDTGDAPLKAGGVATSSEPAAVASSDIVNAYFDTTGHQHVKTDAVIPGVGATNLGKAEDAVHSSGDTGVMGLGVRSDVLASLADTDGDYTPLQVSAIGAVWTEETPGVVDSGNSTTTPLSIGVTFTGDGVDVLAYSGITVIVFADQDGAANGMRFEWSSDNSNWDVSHQHDYEANTGRTFQFGPQAQYFRVVFVNGSSGQSAVRIQTVLHHENGSATTIHRLDDSLAPDRSASVVKSSLMAQQAGTGNFIPIDATAGGNLKVSIEEIDGGASMVVTNSGTFVVQENGAALTALQLIDDVVAVLGTATYTEATTKGNVIGAVRNDDLATLADTDNEIAPLQVDSQGALYVNDAAAESKQDSGVAAGGTPGADIIIAAVSGKKLLITGLTLIATSTTTNNVFLDNVDNDLLGNVGNPIALSISASGDTIPGLVLQYNQAGHFKTDTVNEAVTLNTSAAEDIIWSVTWIETD